MPGNNRTKRVVFFDGASANSSSNTAGPHFVGDFQTMSMSWETVVASTTLILSASNDDGFQSSINTYSTISTVAAQGLFTIDPGMRWLRAVRASAGSDEVAILAGRA